MSASTEADGQLQRNPISADSGDMTKDTTDGTEETVPRWMADKDIVRTVRACHTVIRSFFTFVHRRFK